MSKRLTLVLLVLPTMAMMAACQKAPVAALVATNVEITAPIPGMGMSAAYLMLTNNTDAPIRISKITSEEFASAQMHDTIIENGIAKMRRITELTIPPDSTVTLERGGKHLMLMQADTAVSSVSLHFYNDSTLLLSVQTTVAKGNH